MARFKISNQIEPMQLIKQRFLEIFETVEELKEFFKEILPTSSLIKSIINVDHETEPEKIVDIILAYLGEHFFVDIPSVNVNDKYYKKIKKINDKIKNKKLLETQKTEIINEIDNDADINVEGINEDEYFDFIKKEFEELERRQKPVIVIREKILEQYCKYQKENYETVKKQIIDSFNQKFKTKLNTLADISARNDFNKGNWSKDLCNKTLILPDIIVESSDKAEKLPDSKTLKGKGALPRLYDYQVEALTKIHQIFNEPMDPIHQKRLLLVLPTGAGKTRTAVQSIVEWLNLRDQGKCENADMQQLNENGIIFWLASSNELCTQASDTFDYIFNQIGTAKMINLTNWFDGGRPELRNTIMKSPGTHIVITNTEHTNKNFKKSMKSNIKNRFEKFQTNYFEDLRKRVIAVIIDEAHEVPGNNENEDFLAALGFDFTSWKKGKIYNTSNIVLIGLTATPYKGSGIKENEKNMSYLKSSSLDESELLEMIDDAISNNYNEKTQRLHRIFSDVYMPNPHEKTSESNPIAIIDAPPLCYQNDSVKISGLSSFDIYGKLEYEWTIQTFDKIIIPEDLNQPEKSAVFYHKFSLPGKYIIKLIVNNGLTRSSIKKIITVLPEEESESRNNILNSANFYKKLTENHKILCPVRIGMLDLIKPKKLTKQQKKDWAAGKLTGDNDLISENIEYNETICDIVVKCVNTYDKKRILIFANSVRHSQELKIILRVKYNIENVESVDGKTNPGIRRKIVKEFNEGKIPVLCNFGVFTAGFDVPKIDTVIICRDIGNNALITQMIGRGQRGPKAGGTEELWLFMNKTLHYDEENRLIKLGWESMAENYLKFSDEIKNNLKIKDFEYSKSSTDLKFDRNNFIINYTPIENLQLRCLNCKNKSMGFKESLKFFGYKSEIINDSIKNNVIGMLERDTFHKECLYCREILKKVNKINNECTKCKEISKNIKKIDCKFSEYYAENNRFNPRMIAIGEIALQSKIIRWDKFVKVYDEIISKIGINDETLKINSKIINQLESNGIIKIKNNLEVEFLEINDKDALKNVLITIKKVPKYKENIDLINEENNQNNSNKKQLEISEIEKYYTELKNTLGHVPTTRQFLDKLTPDLQKDFKIRFNKDYKKILKNFRDSLENDQTLKDNLYSEYFTKCIEVKHNINSEELDSTGQFRLDDYKEIWNPIEKFYQKVEHTIEKVLENIDLREDSKYTKEISEIATDLEYLMTIKPDTFYHYEIIDQYSKIGIEKYITQIKITYLNQLINYKGEKLERYIHLIFAFFNLCELIERIPTREEFLKFSPLVVSPILINEFGVHEKNYQRFIDKLIISFESKIDEEKLEKIKDEIKKDIKKYTKNYGKIKAIELVNNPVNVNSKLSIRINAHLDKIDKSEITKEMDSL